MSANPTPPGLRKLLRDLPNNVAGKWLRRLIVSGKRVEGRGVVLVDRRRRNTAGIGAMEGG